jgi:hypothetical protein
MIRHILHLSLIGWFCTALAMQLDGQTLVELALAALTDVTGDLHSDEESEATLVLSETSRHRVESLHVSTAHAPHAEKTTATPARASLRRNPRSVIRGCLLL